MPADAHREIAGVIDKNTMAWAIGMESLRETSEVANVVLSAAEQRARRWSDSLSKDDERMRLSSPDTREGSNVQSGCVDLHPGDLINTLRRWAVA